MKSPPPKLLPRIVEGDIWDHHESGSWIVIPTNMQRYYEGGSAIMGAGLAHQAVQRYEYLNEWYAVSILSHIPEREWPDLDVCSNQFLMEVGFCPNYRDRMIFLPTKRRWRDNAVPELVRLGLQYLAIGLKCAKNDDRTLCIPPLGCGKGNLPYADFLAMVREANLPLARVLIVKPKGFGE